MADQRVPFATHADSTVLGADEIVLNMGPQHPSTHGVLRVKLRLDGEKVIGSECVIGYCTAALRKLRTSHLHAVRAVCGPHGLRRGGSRMAWATAKRLKNYSGQRRLFARE